MAEDPAVARSDADASPPGAAALPVVVSCAVSAYETVSDAAAALRHRGHEVEIVSGADTDGPRLAEAVARFDRQGLYVLCRSGTLDRAAVDTLRGVLRNSEVPFGRTLTLALEPGGARALEERIVSVARRMVTGRGDDRRPGALPPPPQTRSPQGRAADLGVDEAQRRTAHAKTMFPTGGNPVLQESPLEDDEVDQWADSLAGAKRVDLEEAELPTAIGQAAADGLAVEGLGAPQAAADAPSEALRTHSPGDLTQPGSEYPSPPAEESPSAPVPTSDFADFSDGPPSGVDTTQVTRAPQLPATEVSGSEALGDRTGGDDELDDAAFTSGPSRTLMLVGGAAVVLLLVIVSALLISGDDEEPDAVADASDEGGAAAIDATKQKAVREEPKAAEPKPAVPAAEAPDTAEPESAEPVPESAAPEPVPEPSQPDVAEPAPTEPMREPVPDPQPDPQLAPGPPTSEDAAPVLAALRGRELRAWNAYLIADQETKPTTFAGASAYCEGLTIGELSGWRLPTVGELNSLQGAKMIRSGVYWSTTPGDAFGDTQMVVNAKRGTIAAARADWDGGKGLCIRVRP